MPIDCDTFHASWVATVLNLDWPSRASTQIENDSERVKLQKQELVRMFDEATEHGINAVIFQVRLLRTLFINQIICLGLLISQVRLEKTRALTRCALQLRKRISVESSFTRGLIPTGYRWMCGLLHARN